jgi:hypothetical protein
MLDRIPPVATGDSSTYGAARKVQATERGASFRLTAVPGTPATPPAEVLNALDGAARVDEELRSRGLTVSFDVQPKGDVRVRISDSSGAVLHDLAPAHALDALSGESSLDDLAS